ncbi:sensor histidine kinase [Aliterella atlantica]|uniref:histidine kinase n=1 Tax=Aliterella atlantica CENA595 TaxID=1618023 RepID=A0A0D8ZVH6_9CYAN|nr:HAMP domain-containing sensor histidine kinase [Aliterella atlantica]KJH72474.1 ATPase [Aliterella atlantica CENA595]
MAFSQQLKQIFGAKGFFWAARTRILLWYLLTIGSIFAVFIPAFRHVLHERVNDRVHRELTEKMDIFTRLIGEDSEDGDREDKQIIDAVNLLKQADKDLARLPRTKQDLEKFFDAYLGHQLPEDDTFLIAIVDGEFYKSSPRAIPNVLAADSQSIQYWANLTRSEQGQKEFPQHPNIGSVLYTAKPVAIDGKISGILVLAHTTAGERGEVLEAVLALFQVGASVMLLALLLAWIASRQVLAPLHSLTQTTRKIGEFELDRRISVSGKGEIAELATTFNEMMDRLQSAFTSQQEFINDAGHELRTPIAIVRGHLELMGDNPEEVRETLALVMDELDRMSRFVNDMILLAKAERPDFLQLETVELSSFTEELFAKAQALAQRNWQLDSVAKGQLVGDRQRMTQAVMNLVQNATQHTTETDTIALGSAVGKSKISFWVRDTGEGIAPADRERIFERFARAANSRRRSEGAGLGLSIVQAIVEAHGGQVLLQSQLGNGSTFTITLPIEIPKSTKRLMQKS